MPGPERPPPVDIYYKAYRNGEFYAGSVDLAWLMDECKKNLKDTKPGDALRSPIVVVNDTMGISIYLLTDDANGLKTHIL